MKYRIIEDEGMLMNQYHIERKRFLFYRPVLTSDKTGILYFPTKDLAINYCKLLKMADHLRSFQFIKPKGKIVSRL